jgi:hypothetical protein
LTTFDGTALGILKENPDKIYKLYLYALKYCYDDKPDLKDNP